MLIPPYTGDRELDAFLFEVYSNVANVQDSLTANTDTGIISSTENPSEILGFIYKYLSVKYADNMSGLNLSDVPTGKLYFGVLNTDQVVESVNPADYTWIQVENGFGSDKYLWVLLTGNRKADFSVGAEPPDDNSNWKLVPNRSINLDNTITEYKKYLTIRFADDTAGNGLSETPTNKLFYGIYTSDEEVASTVQTDYEWSPYNFSTSIEMYYRAFGGRQIDISPALTKPVSFLTYTNGSFFNLDIPTFAAVSSLGVLNEDPLSVVSPTRYLLLRFADSITGSNITLDPTGKSFFGLQATDVTFSSEDPAAYTWFALPSTLITSINLWYRSIGNNIISFSYTLDSPDSTGWYNASTPGNVQDYIDVYARSGLVVADITSPADGKVAYTQGVNGIYNISLNPYGQGSNTGGFTINPLETSEIQIDEFGRIIQAGALDQVRYSLFVFTATAGQTVFSVSQAQPNQILVFKNGVLCKYGTDYTRTSTNITFTTPCVLNDTVSVYYIRLIDAVTSLDKVPFTTSYINLVNGQTDILHSAVEGSELLFINGVLIVDTDYTYLGNNTGYKLKSSVSNGEATVISFVNNNGNQLIFGENYAETTYGSSLVSFQTPFQRNSSLIWYNGVNLKPTSDFTIPGANDSAYSVTLLGNLTYGSQPLQFASFKSSGAASSGGIGADAVKGMDIEIEIEKKLSIKDLIMDLQSQVDSLKEELSYLKGNI